MNKTWKIMLAVLTVRIDSARRLYPHFGAWVAVNKMRPELLLVVRATKLAAVARAVSEYTPLLRRSYGMAGSFIRLASCWLAA